MNRRGFITGLGAMVGLVVAEPVRRIWAVGANLSRSKTYEWDSIELTLNGQKFIADGPLQFSREPWGARYPNGSFVADGIPNPLTFELPQFTREPGELDGDYALRIKSQLPAPFDPRAPIIADDPGPMIVVRETYEAVTHGPLPATYRFVTDHGDVFKA